MLNFRNKLLLFLSIPLTASSEEKPFIIGELRYELGNQMFQVAATVSLALDAGFEPLFPELNSRSWGIPDNYRYVFWRLNASPPVGLSKPLLPTGMDASKRFISVLWLIDTTGTL